jgi:hypothetical protein
MKSLIRHGRPDVALAFLGGLGDELLCTAPLVEWLQRGARRVWVSTRAPALFHGFDERAEILPDDPRYSRLAARIGREFHYLSYSLYDAATDRDLPPARHLIAEMCARAGLTGAINLRPYWNVSPGERDAARPWRDYIAIQTSTLTAHVPMENKQWPAQRFQEVVNRLSPALKFVQLGSAGDPPLRGVVDRRGATSLRETAAILSEARAFIGLVGFLMHLSRAVDCPAVIIYGGRETPALTGYPCNVNLTSQPSCAPCWQRSRCEFERVCLGHIAATDVLAATTELLARARAPLITDRVTL